jgi:alpha-L-fucosidase
MRVRPPLTFPSQLLQFIREFLYILPMKRPIDLCVSRWFLGALLACLFLLAVPRLPGEENYVPERDPLVLKKLSRWQDVKFGLLMHWGPYSQWGVVESWSICPEDEEWCRRGLPDYAAYVKKYEALKTTFNPVRFDPGSWARAARAAGMRYVVFTTKHHDGFCMFDSRHTDYKVTSPGCPFHSDPRANIAREVFDAFRAAGFMVGAYFSKPDWHSEHYWWPNFPPRDRNVNYDPDLYPERWEKFREFTHAQVLELMSDYGPMDILWLDGGWVAKASRLDWQQEYGRDLARSTSGYLKRGFVDQDIRMDELAAKCRRKQPGLIIVDRAVPGRNQNYLTPENQVPEAPLPGPWESCIISGGGWSYTPQAVYMGGRQAIHLLVDIVAKGGNLLLNVAPGPDGAWQPGAYGLLREYEAWMAVNSEAIYNTRPLAPYKEKNVCLTRLANGSVFFLVLAGSDGAMPAEVAIDSHQPAAGAKVTLLGARGRLAWRPSGRGFTVTFPEELRRDPPCRHAWAVRVSALKQSRDGAGQDRP